MDFQAKSWTISLLVTKWDLMFNYKYKFKLSASKNVLELWNQTCFWNMEWYFFTDLRKCLAKHEFKLDFQSICYLKKHVYDWDLKSAFKQAYVLS